MNRGTASVVQLGKGVTAGSFSGLNVLTNVILGKKEALQKDFNGLVLTDLVMLGKKISHITIITVTVGPAVSPLLLPDAIADSLTYVKAYGGTEQRDIPDDYLQRQFIYMMNGSYLLTDLVPTYDCKVEMDFTIKNIPASACTFLGGRPGETPTGFVFIKSGSGDFAVDAFGDARYSSGITPTVDTRYKFTYANQTATLTSGGSTVFTHAFTGTDATDVVLCIDAINQNGTITSTQLGIYLYSFKMWNGNGELVANYVPAVQKGTVPVVGFYDTVSKTFKTATAGTFAAGGEAVPTPDYPMDIVCNNGVLKVSPNLLDMSPENIEVGKYINNSGGISNSSANFYNTKFISVAPNTTYTWSTSKSVRYISFMEYDSNKGFIQRNLITNAGNLGQFTTGADTRYILVGSNPNASDITLEEILAINWQFELGSTATPYMPYGIYTDGTVETIGAYKNYVDEFIERKFIRAGNISESQPLGSEKTDNNWCCTTYIAVEPNTEYTTVAPSYQSATGAGLVFFGDTTVESAISGVTTQRQGGAVYTFTTPEDCHYLRFCYPRGTGLPAYMYKNSEFQTATCEPLLAVGDYVDVQSILDGVVTRNVGVKVFDGTENWLDAASSTTNRYRVQIADTVGGVSRSAVLSTHFEFASTGQPVGGAFLSAKYLYLIPDQTITTVNDFKQLLATQFAAGTPVIVLYPLAESTTESVTGQTLQVTQGNNVLEITQASIDGLELEAEYEQGVQASVQEIEP